MYTTTDEQGLLNNFAAEPKVYYATEPTKQQQRNYILQGTLAALLVSGLVAFTLVIS